MSVFEPYHIVIVYKVKMLEPDHPSFLDKLGTFAEIAQLTAVPQKHRETVRKIFTDRANELKMKNIDPSGLTTLGCELVAIAMNHQDRDDEEKAQHQQ